MSAAAAAPAQPAPLPQRSWGEAFSDATKSVAQGILDVASLPGVAYGAVTGDYDTSYLNAIRGTQEVLLDEKSPAFQAKAQALQQKLATAEGWREKLAVGGWETLTNPALLGDTLARSAPGMLAGGVLGRAAGGAADAAGNALLGRTIATGSEAAAKSAVALKNAAPAIASGTAVGAAAAQQGASVANDLYAELRKLPASAFAAEPEFQQLARKHGPDKARDILAAAATSRALLVGTGASVLSMKLVPGGDAIEKVFLPSHLKGGAAREAVKSNSFLTQPLTRGMQGNLGTQALEIAVQGLKHGTTGSLSEGAEEASGAVAQGLELSRAGQDVKLSDMAGEAAGPAMAVGFAMDGAAGARRANAARRGQNQPTQPGTPPASPPPPAPTMAHGQTTPAAPTASGPAVPPSPPQRQPLLRHCCLGIHKPCNQIACPPGRIPPAPQEKPRRKPRYCARPRPCRRAMPQPPQPPRQALQPHRPRPQGPCRHRPTATAAAPNKAPTPCRKDRSAAMWARRGQPPRQPPQIPPTPRYPQPPLRVLKPMPTQPQTAHQPLPSTAQPATPQRHRFSPRPPPP
ncbi:hypothetical protein HNP48_006847 [Acidovorax soli]|uniref:Uncharacterized protein n=1 Tax=Acidovorax soli TaxID=592050 RepID=A0A7X0UD49_9BURK|nr:hypothetical protein [Acidovorax soli]MBB6564121.1 hypothetical protein [Acidovorax soli]